MKNATLGGLQVSRLGLGAMTMAGTYTNGGGLDDDKSIRTVHCALDFGVSHIDTAEIYRPFHSEEVVGRATKGRRDEVKIATNFGLVSHAGGGGLGVTDSSPAYVRTQSRARCSASGSNTSTSTTNTASTRSPRFKDTAGAVPS